jgi:ribonuclease T
VAKHIAPAHGLQRPIAAGDTVEKPVRILYAASMNEPLYNPAMGRRFRGFLPVVVDVETGGFDPRRDALLEIAAVILRLDDHDQVAPAHSLSCHLEPFPGAHLDPRALAFNGIDPYHPFRGAVAEPAALDQLFQPVRRALRASGCHRAILVGHNAAFDLAFLNAAVERCGHRRNPFHPFSTLDTVTLAALAYGHTVLARAVQLAGLPWDNQAAHSALYDAERTAELFCTVINQWQTARPRHPWTRDPAP